MFTMALADPIVMGPVINQSPGAIGLDVTSVTDADAEHALKLNVVRSQYTGYRLVPKLMGPVNPLLRRGHPVEGHPVEGHPVEFDLEKSAYELIRCRRHSL